MLINEGCRHPDYGFSAANGSGEVFLTIAIRGLMHLDVGDTVTNPGIELSVG